jgi:hypothetical protein
MLYPTTPAPGAAQFRSTWCALPLPLRAMEMVELLDELLLMVSFPLAAPVVAGSKVRVTDND